MGLKENLGTVCVGGPMHGMVYCVRNSVDHFIVPTPAMVPTLGDDLIESPDNSATMPVFKVEHYHLKKIILDWPTGMYWTYYFWAHESIAKCPEVILDVVRLSDCYVERHHKAPSIETQSSLFQYGTIVLSCN